MSELEERLKKVKRASVNSGNFTTELKNKALEAVAVALEENFADIKEEPFCVIVGADDERKSNSNKITRTVFLC